MVQPFCSAITDFLYQNAFNPTSGNLEVLIIQHLRRAIPGLEVLLFTRKSLISGAGRY